MIYYGHNREDYHMKDLLKKVVKAPMFLILSVIVILSTMSACILSINAAKPSSETNQYIVTFPTYTDAIEKLEYSIGTIGEDSSSKKPKWEWDDWKSVDGELSAKVTNQNKIKFLVKFKEGYNDYPVNNVKIKSNAQGEDNTTGLVVYELKDNNQIVTRKPYDNEKINSKTSYSSEEISINQDQTLYFSDIIPNKYSLTLNIPVSEEIFDVYYDMDNDTTSQKQTKKIASEHKGNNYVYTLKDVPYGTVTNFEMRLKDKYSQLADKNFDIFPRESGDYFLKVDNSSRKFAWEAKENTEVNFDVTDKIEIVSNKYDIKNTTGKTLYYKENNSKEDAKVLQQGESINIEHGTTCSFYTQDGDTLVYDDNKGMNTSEENEKTEYYVSDITDDHNINIKKESSNSKFAVTFPQNDGLRFVDTDGNDLSKTATTTDSNTSMFVDEGKPFEFKLKEVPGYTNYIKNVELTENSRPLVADENGIYTLKNVNENITVLADDAPQLDERKIKIARNATRNLTMTITSGEKTINPEQDEEDELYDIYKVSNGATVKIDFKSNDDLDLINMKLLNKGNEVPGGTKFAKNAYWEFKCTEDMLLTISDVSRVLLNFTFDNNGGDTEIVYAGINENIESEDFNSSYYTTTNGKKKIALKPKQDEYNKDIPNMFQVPYESDVYLKFTSKVLDDFTIKGPNGKISSEDGYYVIKNVTEDTNLSEEAIKDKKFKVTIFSSLEKRLEFSTMIEKSPIPGNITFPDRQKYISKCEYEVPYGDNFLLNYRLLASEKDNEKEAVNCTLKETISDEIISPDYVFPGSKVCITTLNNITSDKFLFFYDKDLSDSCSWYVTSGNPFFKQTQLVSVRNMTSKYKLVKGTDDNEDYDINFRDYATDMEEKLEIRTKAGKEYNMKYQAEVGKDDQYENINSGVGENLSGCDMTFRYNAPEKLNIKLDYGKKCNAENFIGFQFDAVKWGGEVVEDVFGLRKKFLPGNYNEPYITTKGDKGNLPTDSLRGFFQIHWISTTLLMGRKYDNDSNFSVFNTKRFKYDDMTFYSLLLRTDNLNYVAKDRDVTPDDDTSSVLLYSNQRTKGGCVAGVPYKLAERKTWGEIKNYDVNWFNRTYAPYKMNDNKTKLYIEGKGTSASTGINTGNMELNIRTNTLLVYDNRDNRYEDDICLKQDFDNWGERDRQNVRSYEEKYGYPQFLTHKDNWGASSTLDGAYLENKTALFNIYSLDTFKEIRIKPIFDVEYLAKNPSVTLPIDTTGIKFHKCNGVYPGEQITTSKIELDEKDPNSWFHEKDKDGNERDPWCYKFIIKPDKDYNFIPGSVKTFPEGYSVISYEEKNSEAFGKYYIYYVKNFKAPEAIVSVPEVEKYKYTVTFNEGYTTFRDNETKEQLLKKELTIGSEFVFKTEPQVGYQSNETLTINAGNDTFKITPDTPDGKEGNRIVNLPKGTTIERLSDDSSGNNLYKITGIVEDFSVYSTRDRTPVPIILTYDSSVYYKDVKGKYMTMAKDENGNKKLAYVDDPKDILSENIELTVDYGSNFYFTIEEREGFDPLSTIVTANNIKLDYENGKYSIKNVTSETTVKIDNSAKISYKAYFTDHEGLTFKSVDGKDLIGDNTVSYGSDLIFKISISEAYSNSENYKIMVEYSTEGKKPTEVPKEQNADGKDTDRYILTNIQENVRIYVEGLEHNTYKMKLYDSTGILYYDKYGQEKYTSNGEFVEKTVYHGDDFSFKIFAEEGYDISQIKVYSKQEKSGFRKQLLPSNGVYTIEKSSDNCIITVENTKKSVYNLEIRTTSGAKCLDDNGNVLNSNITVNHGDSFGFTITLDKAYDHSTPIVTLKGSINTINPVDGKYIISNITENKIIEITGVKKNTYKATFKETEGVIYKNGKNKPFTGSLDAEDGETLNFKITLMDAYDKSSPIVLLNNSKPIAESAGVYSINNVSSDLEISVENVYKNPEEVTMEDVNNVPDKVSTELDISRVVEATKTYLNLSDEEKAEVTNLAELKRAQQEAGVINHKSGDISVTGLDWNIKVIVDKLTGDQEKVDYMNGKIDRREVIYLYDIYLIDLLTDKVYEIPYGNKVTVTMPAPDLSGYKNEVVVHEKSNGNIEYIDMNITDGTARFDATSFSLFGIAAKKIPNYSDPSGTKIHVSDLVDNEGELQALLGEGVSSQLGDLTENKNDFDILGGEEGILSKGKSGLAALYEWILNHELLSVIIILIIGSLLIFLIILRSQKENTTKN